MNKPLHEKNCVACEGIGKALDNEQIKNLKSQIDSAWNVLENPMRLEQKFVFKNYYQTMAFVNALAWIAHQENHHPDIKVTYNSCEIIWSTHALCGLSMNDFICAAKVDKLSL
jgi:4a-hydroxytetrahydrobiopterin dehydratase